MEFPVSGFDAEIIYETQEDEVVPYQKPWPSMNGGMNLLKRIIQIYLCTKHG